MDWGLRLAVRSVKIEDTKQKGTKVRKVTLTEISPSCAIAQRNGKDVAYIALDKRLGSPTEGLWEARPVHDTLTVGKMFPLFATRRAAVEYVANNY